MFRRHFQAAFAALSMLAACGQIEFDELSDQGRFDGAVLVLWVGEGDNSAGAGRFVYIPFPGRELTFTRDLSANQDATLAVVRPGTIYTDGGSIPRLVQPLKGFSPWGYAPAYMVHDWLFAAKRCWDDADATEAEKELQAMEFEESAEIMGEAIKSLIRQRRVGANDVAPGAITSAVAGPISRGLWGTGDCVRLEADHQALVDEFLRRRSAGLARSGVQPVDRVGDQLRVVGVVEF